MNNLYLYLLGSLVIFFCSAHSQIDSSSTESMFEGKNEILPEQINQSEHIDDVVNDEQSDSVPQTVLMVRSRVSRQLQQSSGYREGDYLGSSLKSYQRVQFRQGSHLSGGVLFSKDAGEQRFNDFTSASLSIEDFGLFRRIVVGDFRMEAGQGIALWRGYGFSKGADVVAPVYRKGRGLISSLSSDEAGYFRGLAAQFRTGNFETTLFYSRRFESATHDQFDNVTSLYTAGYYRTDNEQLKRNAVTETLFGMRAIYHISDQNNIGVTIYKTLFSSRLILNKGLRFNGDRYSMMSIDYRLQYQSLIFFGEWARMNSTLGGIGGILLKPSESVSFISSYRYYPPAFFSYHGSGFGERSEMYNEQGWYLGLSVRFSRAIELSAYYDVFRFPEPSFSSKFPSGGRDMLADLRIEVTPHLVVTVRYRRAISEVSQLVLDYQQTQHARLEVEYHLYGGAQFRSRFERIFIDNKYSLFAEKGFAMYQDVVFKLQDRLWSNFRLAFFSTDSYYTRIIFFERDLEGAMALPVLYGSGIRWYMVLRYHLNARLELSAKYSDIIRDDVKHLGTGLDELPTSHDNRVGVQVDVTY